MRSLHLVSIVALCLLGASAAPAWAQQKTAKVCKEEYSANKPAIKAAKEKKGDFIAACKALPVGTATPIGSAAAAPAPAAPRPAPAPTPAAPMAAPAPAAPSSAPAQRTQATPAGPGENACGNGYAHLPANHTAVQFCTDAEAQRRCPGAPVVWLNTKSGVFHAAGKKSYGHTKQGAYMCQSDAATVGRAAKK